MLIIAKKAFRFKLRDKDTKKVIQTAEVRPQIITNVPEWVRNDDLFKLAVKDESITFVENAKTQTPQNNADEELAALRARAVELQIPRAGQLGRERLVAAITEAEEAAAKIEAEEKAKAEAEAKAKAEAQNQ
jgi:hypothetical protein